MKTSIYIFSILFLISFVLCSANGQTDTLPVTTNADALKNPLQPPPNSLPELFLCVFDSKNMCDDMLPTFLCNQGCITKNNKFNQVLAKNCYFNDSKNGNAITPKYITIYDQSNNDLTYLKLKNEKGFEYYKIKKTIQPLANHEMQFVAIISDTGYTLKVESEEYFKEYEESFAESVKNAGAQKTVSETNNQTSTSAEEQKGNTKDNLSEMNLKLETKLQSLEDAIIILINRHSVERIIGDSYYNDLSCLRLKIFDQLKISVKPVLDGRPSKVTVPNPKAGLENKDTLASPENDSLTSLAKYIIESDSLVKDLIKLIQTSQNENISEIIAYTIGFNYLRFLKLQINGLKIYGVQIQIPDKDFVKLVLNKKSSPSNEPEIVLSRDLRISGGFKIDFSAGIFLSGISVPEFITRSQTFKFKPLVYTVDPLTGALDSVYSGSIKDTVGNLIYVKNPKATYSAGFLSHAYVRSGSFANAGIASGFLVNNDGFQILLGVSTLLNIRKARMSFSGGISIGKQRTISPTANSALWKNTPLTSQVIEQYQIPTFFEGTDVPYYERWTTSWFIGVTYNFSSIVVHW